MNFTFNFLDPVSNSRFTPRRGWTWERDVASVPTTLGNIIRYEYVYIHVFPGRGLIDSTSRFSEERMITHYTGAQDLSPCCMISYSAEGRLGYRESKFIDHGRRSYHLLHSFINPVSLRLRQPVLWGVGCPSTRLQRTRLAPTWGTASGPGLWLPDPCPSDGH